MPFLRRCTTVVAILAMLLAILPPISANSQPASGTVSGSIVTQVNGLSIGGATVTLYRDNAVIATTTSTPDGQYKFANEPPGVYSVMISATGYTAARIDDVVVAAGSMTSIKTPLLVAQTLNGDQLQEIGSTRSSGLRGNTLASSSTIQTDLDPVALQQQGFLNGAYAIGQVPGVNLEGGPHSVGDDVFIDIRGMGQGEVRPLIDGHPAGPIGVFSTGLLRLGQLAVFAAAATSRSREGSGAAGLYGVDVIGGTIDLQTLNPTSTTPCRVHAGISAATERSGRSSRRAGTRWPTRLRIRPRRDRYVRGLQPGVDLPGCSAEQQPQPSQRRRMHGIQRPHVVQHGAEHVYLVSGNYKVLNDLGKLRWNFSPSTTLTFTAYAGNTGIPTIPATATTTTFPTRRGSLRSKRSRRPAMGTDTSSSPTPIPTACYTAQQWAAQSYGPFGGGEDRNRGTTLQDFNANGSRPNWASMRSRSTRTATTTTSTSTRRGGRTRSDRNVRRRRPEHIPTTT